MRGWFVILVWWLAFAATHLGLSAMAVRRPLVEKLGERAFLAIYSVISLVTFVPLVRAFWANRGTGPVLWNLGSVSGVRWFGLVLAGLGILMAVLALVQPSPSSLAGGEPRARGVIRITRHPLFCGFALWGFGHALVNGFLADVIFFGGFVPFSVLGAFHQDQRKRATGAETLQPFFAETSVVPFGAILSGRNRLVAGEIAWPAVVGGLVTAAVLYGLHPWLFLRAAS